MNRMGDTGTTFLSHLQHRGFGPHPLTQVLGLLATYARVQAKERWTELRSLSPQWLTLERGPMLQAVSMSAVKVDKALTKKPSRAALYRIETSYAVQ
jgi:hypothetical protein